MKNDSIKDEGLQDLLREIDSAETKCLEALKRLQRQRLELTCQDAVDFTVSTIHKDRIGTILDLIMRVDKEKSYSQLKKEYRASAQATTDGWFGVIQAIGSKERLISVLPKLAKNGATVTVDPAHKIDVPPPNKFWDIELEIEMDAKRYAESLEELK